jgi:DNA-binding NarL/FixJ family response regulator
VLDARLPDGTGIEVCRDVRSLDETLNCLILTSYDDMQALRGAVLAGAAGYVLKEIGGSDLVGALRRAARGESLFDPGLKARILAGIAEPERVDPRVMALTPQERRVLDLICEGLTNRQIGERMALAEKTVKNYVSSLLAKLGFERRTQAAVHMAHEPPPGP